MRDRQKKTVSKSERGKKAIREREREAEGQSVSKQESDRQTEEGSQ